MQAHHTFLHQALLANNFLLPQSIQAQLLFFLDLLERWNKTYNLTAIRKPHDMIMLHLLDSLVIAPFLHGTRCIDVGSGAGFPGMPLAITQPELEWVLLDSQRKKATFLRHAVYELGLKNVEIVHARCEDFKPAYRFDSVVSRAFAAIRDMLVKTQHLLAPNGQFLAMKGVLPTAEIQAMPAKFTCQAIHALKINGLSAARHVVIMSL